MTLCKQTAKGRENDINTAYIRGIYYISIAKSAKLDG